MAVYDLICIDGRPIFGRFTLDEVGDLLTEDGNGLLLEKRVERKEVWEKENLKK